MHQEEWDCFLVKYSGSSSLWKKFVEFLSNKNTMAIASQLRCMSLKAEPAMASNLHDNQGKSNQTGGVGAVWSNMTLAEVTSRVELNKCVAEMQRILGPCPCCNRSHTYEKNFSFEQVMSQRLG